MGSIGDQLGVEEHEAALAEAKRAIEDVLRTLQRDSFDSSQLVIDNRGASLRVNQKLSFVRPEREIQ